MGTVDTAADALSRLVEDRRIGGGVLAVRRAGRTEVRCAGVVGLDGDRADVPVTPSTPFWLASASKPVGAVLAQALLADGLLALDDEVARWIPELATPRVLRDPTGPLSDTEPAARAIRVRDVVSGTAGLGIGVDCFTEPPPPLLAAMTENGVGPGPFSPDLEPDVFMARLGALPLATQPGAAWRYHTPTDVLSVLVARAADRLLPDLLHERLLAPLGLASTGFGRDDLTTADVVDIVDPVRSQDGPVAATAPDPRRPPALPSFAAGLLSTAEDLFTFACAMADGGTAVLPAGAVEAMTTPVLGVEQRTAAAPFLEPGMSWGLGVGVDVKAAPSEAGAVEALAWHSPGRWGWVGGTGTAVHVDPANDLVVVLLTGPLMQGPDDTPDAVWRALVGAPSESG